MAQPRKALLIVPRLIASKATGIGAPDDMERRTAEEAMQMIPRILRFQARLDRLLAH